jgi:hypothetical protein
MTRLNGSQFPRLRQSRDTMIISCALGASHPVRGRRSRTGSSRRCAVVGSWDEVRHAPAEHYPTQQIKHRLVLHDICRSHDGMENDARLAPVRHVMVVVSQGYLMPTRLHGDCVGIGRTHLSAALALIAMGVRSVRVESTFFELIPAGIVAVPQCRQPLRWFEVRKVLLGQEAQARDERIEGGVGTGFPLGSSGRVEDQFLTPDQPRSGTLLGNHVKEAPEDRQTQTGRILLNEEWSGSDSSRLSTAYHRIARL